MFHYGNEAGVKLPESMSKKGRKAPKFGAFLEEKRGKRSLGSVTKQLEGMKIEISRTTLLRYEQGRQPPLEVLRGLADVYRLPLSEMIDLLFNEVGVKAVKWPGDAGAQIAPPLSLQGIKEKDSDVLDDPEIDLLEAYRTLSKRGKEYIASVASDLRRAEVERALSTHRARKSAQILKLTQQKEGGSP